MKRCVVVVISTFLFQERVQYAFDHYFFFFLMIRRPPRSTLFLYTTLFRSVLKLRAGAAREVFIRPEGRWRTWIGLPAMGQRANSRARPWFPRADACVGHVSTTRGIYGPTKLGRGTSQPAGRWPQRRFLVGS